MEGKGCLCYSTKDVEYSPNVFLIEGCLDYLYTIKYGQILCGTIWVSIEVVVVVIVVLEVVVAVLVPAI